MEWDWFHFLLPVLPTDVLKYLDGWGFFSSPCLGGIRKRGHCTGRIKSSLDGAHIGTPGKAAGAPEPRQLGSGQFSASERTGSGGKAMSRLCLGEIWGGKTIATSAGLYDFSLLPIGDGRDQGVST